MNPWVLGSGPWCADLAARCPVEGCVVLDVLDSATVPFFHLTNAANARAFAGLAMPSWVQLDCACLPAGIIGLGAARADVDAALYTDLAARVRLTFGDAAGGGVDAWQGLVPLAEYTCVPTPALGHVVGFSHYSIVSGLGLRTKAMALAMHGARVQTGVAQVDNAALRMHAALGPLDVRAAGIAVHPMSSTTIVYALRVPPLDVLARIARGGALPERAPGSVRLPLGPTVVSELAQLMKKGPRAIVDVTKTELVLE
jgi:hypothetical protein